jgi:hypothetical protein
LFLQHLFSKDEIVTTKKQGYSGEDSGLKASLVNKINALKTLHFCNRLGQHYTQPAVDSNHIVVERRMRKEYIGCR